MRMECFSSLSCCRGLLSAVIAVLTGNQAYEVLKSLENDRKNIYEYEVNLHELFATLSLWLFTALFFFRVYISNKKNLYTNYKYIISIFALIGAALILIAGYYGGVLVYDYGIGTKLF